MFSFKLYKQTPYSWIQCDLMIWIFKNVFRISDELPDEIIRPYDLYTHLEAFYVNYNTFASISYPGLCLPFYLLYWFDYIDHPSLLPYIMPNTTRWYILDRMYERRLSAENRENFARMGLDSFGNPCPLRSVL